MQKLLEKRESIRRKLDTAIDSGTTKEALALDKRLAETEAQIADLAATDSAAMRFKNRQDQTAGVVAAAANPAVAAAFGTMAPATRSDVNVIERGGMTHTEWAKREGLIPASTTIGIDDEPQPLSLQRFVRGLHTNNWVGAEAEAEAMQHATARRAQSGMIGSLGGYAVPAALSAEIQDLVMAKSAVFGAGARVVPWEGSDEHSIAKLNGRPATAWRNQNEAIATGTATYGAVKFVARTITSQVKVPIELLQDGAFSNFEDQLRGALADAVALEVDRAALVGDGSDAWEPVGLFNAPGVSTDSLASVADYDQLIDMQTAVETADYQPGEFLLNPDSAKIFRQLKVTGTSSEYQVAPAGIDFRKSTQVPAAHVATGQWDQLLIGERFGTEIIVTNESLATSGAITITAFGRYDVKVLRPSAFVVATDLS